MIIFCEYIIFSEKSPFVMNKLLLLCGYIIKNNIYNVLLNVEDDYNKNQSHHFFFLQL